MNEPRATHSGHLLEYHLGLLSDDEAERVRQELAGSNQSASRSRNVSEWVKLLDLYDTPSPPNGFVDQIMDRIGQTAPLRVTEAASSLPPSSEGRFFRRPVLSLRELVALAACITFFIGVVVPGIAQNRSQARRALCTNSLGNIGRGLGQYAASFGGPLPQVASFLPGVNWLKPPSPSQPRVSNSRNRYLVLRLRFTKPEDFICAAMNRARAMDADQIEQFEDFPALENCSFDSQNVAGPTVPLSERYCVPVYADRNPLFDGGKLNAVNPFETNSRSHDGGSGQNVLCSDGRVVWTTTPVFGPNGDNIWQVQGVTRYTGTEYQQHPADAFVIP